MLTNLKDLIANIANSSNPASVKVICEAFKSEGLCDGKCEKCTLKDIESVKCTHVRLTNMNVR